MAITADGDLNIFDYSVQEDATPLNPGDAGGGYGQITYTIRDSKNAVRQITKETTIIDDSRGRADGEIINVSGTDGYLSVTADSALHQMSAWHSVKPYQGTLQGYLNVLKKLVKLDRPLVTNITGTFRANGFVGNVWENFKLFLSANSLEIVPEGTSFRVRKIRSTETSSHNTTTETWTVDTGESAEFIRVPWRDTVGWETKVEIFPVPSNDEFQPLSVGANEILEQEITIDGSITAVFQPTCVANVSASGQWDGTNGVYSVSGNDGKPIEPSRWKSSGGWLRVETTKNPSVIKVIVKGGKVEEYAPYHIAMTAGASNYYNSLHITGTGFRWTEQQIEMSTGAPRSESEETSAAEVANIHLLSQSQAFTAALIAARAQGGSHMQIEGTTQRWKTDQSFGTPMGARVKKDHGWYRVKSQTIVPSTISYILEGDTTLGDFTAHQGNMTIAQFNSRYDGFRMIDFDARPLQ